jgi:uncharacterized protein (DUF1800 family)
MRSRIDLLSDPAACWSPWRPGGSDWWDEAKAAHLHRRAGFGATWGQVRRDTQEGFECAVRRVVDGDTHCPDGRPASEIAQITEAMVASARREPSIERVQYLWFFRMIFSPDALAERMTLVWHGHYATSNHKVANPLLMLEQNLSQRELWRSRISKLHLRMLNDRAMLVWLDGLSSRKSQPNENLGREFLELFALGEGNYNEADIRAVARALTGWEGSAYSPEQIYFDQDEHDASAKTILGQTGNWQTDDVVRIACAQPAAAVHVARRLFRAFVADGVAVPTGLLEPLASAMRVEGDVDVARGIELILHSRLFFSEWCRGKRVKNPVELVIGAIRACERFDPPPDFIELEGWLARMGQRLFYPLNVAGWPDGLDWLRGPTILARAAFATAMAGDDSQSLRVAAKYGLERSDGWADALATLILGTSQSIDHSRRRSIGEVSRDVLSLPEAQLA